MGLRGVGKKQVFWAWNILRVYVPYEYPDKGYDSLFQMPEKSNKLMTEVLIKVEDLMRR